MHLSLQFRNRLQRLKDENFETVQSSLGNVCKYRQLLGRRERLFRKRTRARRILDSKSQASI
jgi:hypothetical protein